METCAGNRGCMGHQMLQTYKRMQHLTAHSAHNTDALIAGNCWQRRLDRVLALYLIDVGGVDGSLQPQEVRVGMMHVCKGA